MTTTPAPKAHKPDHAPSKSDLEERDRYARLTAASADTVRSSATAWRNGLTAFITLVTTAVVIQGRSTTTGLTTSWRTAITILIGGGLLLAVLGLWQALAAEAGTEPHMQTLQELRSIHGTLDAYEVHLAASAAHRLQLARRAVAAAITALLIGIALTWWAPAAGSPPPGYVNVTYGHALICGTLRPSGTGTIRVAVQGRPEPVTIRISEITGLAPRAACPWIHTRNASHAY